MARRKSAELPEGAAADIKLALHEKALTGRNKKRKSKKKITGDADERFKLYDKMMRGEASCREIVYLSFLKGMITKEQYADYLQIEKESAEYEKEDGS